MVQLKRVIFSQSEKKLLPRGGIKILVTTWSNLQERSPSNLIFQYSKGVEFHGDDPTGDCNLAASGPDLAATMQNIIASMSEFN